MPGARADIVMRRVIAGFDEPFEGGIFAQLRESLPDGALVVVGSSMPVRDLDAFLASSDVQVTLPCQPGCQRHRRCRLDGPRRRRGERRPGAAHRGRRVLRPRPQCPGRGTAAACRRPSWSSTTTAAASSRSCPRVPPSGPSWGCPEHYEQLFGTPHGVDVLAIARILGAETAERSPPPSVRPSPHSMAPTGRPGPACCGPIVPGTWRCIARSRRPWTRPSHDPRHHYRRRPIRRP